MEIICFDKIYLYCNRTRGFQDFLIHLFVQSHIPAVHVFYRLPAPLFLPVALENKFFGWLESVPSGFSEAKIRMQIYDHWVVSLVTAL